ncbi:hemolysin family protein [Bacillus licheniformis]|uniref:2-oxo acid dehydrogenase, lipoyl-binding site protein n=4 Tax=Bacillus licheniformis TaxID=1402 RepID=A5A645_BACLD|nr:MULTISPECIES: hemolysin family protein [Bacillus]MBJ7885105.1 HlyC/CorC family transporter [Bacillaceae bacterium HSR45]MBY8348266.1 HlyC/CorC family transporter [Bacillus sp. PCH94]MDP4082367.1 hemolysin family protein [Bacillota bacterium]AAU25327.2 2-oxo acid dehydrogenase, lipoyl-binding site protein [Bacillus licheniformis DSM 13 = ATCC 14580]AKQ75154.1 2-oxo acid dehydrogenase, lipoyl-binding site protein [Bacillus licheniformis WX-02]
MELLKLIAVAGLIAFTGFFVAVEFAIVKVRRTKIDQLIIQKKKGALAAKEVTSHLDEYLSACQLGITVTALGLGWLGEPTMQTLLHPLFSKIGLNESITHILSFLAAFLSVTYLNVVVGELAPKTIAIQKAETVTLLFAQPMIWFYRIMFPFIWLLNHSARMITSLFGLKPTGEHELAYSEEELRTLLSESYRSGEINQNELKYVNNIFKFDERTAKEIMVPRNEMTVLSLDDSLKKAKQLIKETKHTRFPVMEEDKDHITGMINIKELLLAELAGEFSLETKSLKPYIHPVIHVIETIPVYQLFVKMQKEHTHMAILVDEYGGTSGLVTVEDIVEEIVGDIRDEFDTEEVSAVQKLEDDHYILNAKVLVSDVNDLLGIHLSDEEIDTIGGWMLTQNIESKPGTTIESEGYRFKVKEMDGHRIVAVEVEKTA